MPSMLGKRKARPAEDKEEDDSAAAAARDLLRKHFEARFKPVAAPGPAVHASKSQRNEDDDSEDDDDYDDDEDDETISDESSDGEWGGLSGEEQDSGMALGSSWHVFGKLADQSISRYSPCRSSRPHGGRTRQHIYNDEKGAQSLSGVYYPLRLSPRYSQFQIYIRPMAR